MTWAIVAAVALVAAAALVLAARSHRLRRSGRLGWLSVVSAIRWVGTKARSVGKDSGERQRLLDEYHERTAEQAAQAMGNMKGALMKLGQMVSFIDSGLPAPYREALRSLQADAPPMPYPMIEEAVAMELGGPPDELFASFDREPLAAASIGQVHAARLEDGREVVVKVQYPGIDKAIRADLDNVEMIYKLFSMTMPGLDPKPLVDEMRARIVEELDYDYEARNQARFCDLYRDHPFIVIPEVVPERCSARVITMERVDGARWAEAIAAPSDLKQRWAEVVYRYVFGTLNRYRMFNGDPHPGNYLFRPDGTVAFLDYGCTKHFSERDVMRQRGIVASALRQDGDTLWETLVAEQFITDDTPLSRERVLEWFTKWYEPLLADGPYAFTPDFAEEAARSNFDVTSEWSDIQKHFNMPAGYVFLSRINLGLNSILAALEATGPWMAITREYWEDGPPATELGRLDAGYRASRAATLG